MTIKTASAAEILMLDYPLKGEVVTTPDYTVRISAGGAARVEVAVDGEDWRPCRPAVGYWWYDWSGYRSGSYLLRVEAYDADGQAMALESRRISVLLPQDAAAGAGPARRRRHG